jgi:hypothetical protein
MPLSQADHQVLAWEQAGAENVHDQVLQPGADRLSPASELAIPIASGNSRSTRSLAIDPELNCPAKEAACLALATVGG